MRYGVRRAVRHSLPGAVRHGAAVHHALPNGVQQRRLFTKVRSSPEAEVHPRDQVSPDSADQLQAGPETEVW